MTYHYGNSDKKILLVHGWSGRGTQLFKIADELIRNNYSTISFDAPAHGKSPGQTSIMTDFIESILEIDKQFGPFEAIIGHSLGGMSTLNAINKGLKVKNATVIGSGDVVQDIVDDYNEMKDKNSKVLVICPASLKTNWKREIETFIPSNEISIIRYRRNTLKHRRKRHTVRQTGH